MHIFFYHLDGSPEMGRQFTSPGRSHFAQNELICQDFTYCVGDTVVYHTGHGIYHAYVVEAKDEHTALVRRQLQ